MKGVLRVVCLLEGVKDVEGVEETKMQLALVTRLGLRASTAWPSF